MEDGSLVDRASPRSSPSAHGRGAEGRLRALHAQGDPRAAAGRRASSCTCSTRARTTRAPWSSSMRRRAAALPRRLRHQLPRRLRRRGLSRRGSPGAPRSPCWRRSSSPQYAPDARDRGRRASSSARAARPRTCSTRSSVARARGTALLRPGQRGRLDADAREPGSTCRWPAATRSACRPPRRSSTRSWRSCYLGLRLAGTRHGPADGPARPRSRRRSATAEPQIAALAPALNARRATCTPSATA